MLRRIGGAVRLQQKTEVNDMAIDWPKIRNDYINGGGSQRALAENTAFPLRLLPKNQELKTG